MNMKRLICAVLFPVLIKMNCNLCDTLCCDIASLGYVYVKRLSVEIYCVHPGSVSCWPGYCYLRQSLAGLRQSYF